MKLHLKAECREEDLIGALNTAKIIMDAIQVEFMEIKVITHQHTAGSTTPIHRYVSITRQGNPLDVERIYNLEKEVNSLKEKLSLKSDLEHITK